MKPMGIAIMLATCVQTLACTRDEHVECDDAASCNLGMDGRCVTAPTGRRWCAYRDPACTSGSRYSRYDVGDDLAGACVAPGEVGAAPRVVEVIPDDAQAGADRYAPIRLRFSEPMDGASLTTSSVLVADVVGPVPGAVAYDPTTYTAVFTPSTALRRATAHSIEVTVAAASASGVAMAAPFTTAFATSPGMWLPPSAIPVSEPVVGGPLLLATSARGTAVALWFQIYIGGTLPWAASYSPTTGWGEVGWLEQSAGTPIDPQLGIDSQGRALALWSRRDNDRVVMRWARRVPTEGWAPSGGFNASDLEWQEMPRLAMTSGGDAMAVWFARDGRSSPQTLVQRRFLAGEWGPSTPVPGATGWASELAANDRGQGLVLWVDAMDWRSSYYTPRTGWSQQMMYSGIFGAPSQRIAMDEEGEVTLVSGITARKFKATGWVDVPALRGWTSYIPEPTSIGLDRSGTAHVVWVGRQHPDDPLAVWSAQIARDGGWGKMQRLDAPDAGAASQAQIAVNARGDAIAVWRQDDGQRARIWANTYVPGVGWGTALAITADPGADAESAAIGIDGDGNGTAVWIQSDGVRPRVYGAALR